MDKTIDNSSKELRVDYSKYEVDEIAEIISEAIIFPVYIGKIAIKVLFTFIVSFILLSYFFTSNFFFGFMFFLLSLILSVPSIVFISCLLLTNTIKNDLNKIIKICFDTSKYVYLDSKLIYNQRELGLPLKSTFNDVFRGVAIYVIRPSLKKVMLRKIKFLALPFTFIIDQIFGLIFIRKKIKTSKSSRVVDDSQIESTNDLTNELDSIEYKDFKIVSVPETNFYRRLKEVLHLDFLYKETRCYYGISGQASIDPLVFFKFCLVGYFENMISDRKLMAHCSMRLDILYFLGYDIDERLPWHSTISSKRQLFPESVFEDVFRHVCR